MDEETKAKIKRFAKNRNRIIEMAGQIFNSHLLPSEAEKIRLTGGFVQLFGLEPLPSHSGHHHYSVMMVKEKWVRVLVAETGEWWTSVQISTHDNVLEYMLFEEGE